MKTRQNVFLWLLYDFANSIVSIVFFLYFAQWIIVEQGIPDLTFNLAFTASAFLLLLSVPFTGFKLDSHWRRIAGLRISTCMTVVSYGACAYAVHGGHAYAALILFAFGLFSYLLSFTFYTPLIQDIASPERRGRISGYGIAANYAGQLAGLLMVLPISNGSISFFGGSPRAETLIPAISIFFILALPMLIWFKEDRKSSAGASLTPIKTLHACIREGIVLFRHPGIFFFFLAYFLFNDAVLTVSNNFPVYMEQVWHVGDSVKTYILLCVLVSSIIGGYASGHIADRFGHKRTLQWILAGWAILLPLLAFIDSLALLFAAAAFMGLWYGSVWTVSRSVMGYLAPEGRHNSAFGYFGLVERASSFVGPVAWGLIVTGFISIGSDRYRIAVAAMAVFVACGMMALRKVPGDR